MTLSGSMYSDARLNELLRQRAALGGDPRPALVASYLGHALAVACLLLVVRGDDKAKPHVQRGTGGVMAITPLRGLPKSGGAARTAAPVAATAAPVAAPAPPVAALPPPVAERKVEPTRPDPPKPARAENQIHEERRPAEADRRPKKLPASGAGSSSVTPGAARAAQTSPASPTGGGQSMLAPSTGPAGSASGSIDGAADGGLGALLGSNHWYVQRVQDIVYKNWADPFAGGNRPPVEIEVELAFRIHRDGRVSDISVSKSSGNQRWDRAGLRAVEGARLPPLPADYYGDSVRILYTFYDDFRH